jgi:hypothetical protein
VSRTLRLCGACARGGVVGSMHLSTMCQMKRSSCPSAARTIDCKPALGRCRRDRRPPWATERDPVPFSPMESWFEAPLLRKPISGVCRRCPSARCSGQLSPTSHAAPAGASL